MRWVRCFGTLLLLVLIGLAAIYAWGIHVEIPPVPDLAGTFKRKTVDWDVRRHYSTYRPVDAPRRAPLVIVLHASQGDGDQARAMTNFGFDRLADEFGFVVAYPNGWKKHWNDCRKAGPYEANRLGVNDVGFLYAMIGRIALEEGVGYNHVYVTGVSNGGQMALRLALEAPQMVRAVAPVAASMPAGENMGCKPSGTALPVMLVNGTADAMNPYEGGEVAFFGLFASRGDVLSTEESVRYWAELAASGAEPVVERLPDRDPDDRSVIEVRRWADADRPEVVLYSVVGGGHTLPNLEWTWPRLLGPTNRDIDGPREIWKFFDRVGGYSARRAQP